MDEKQIDELKGRELDSVIAVELGIQVVRLDCGDYFANTIGGLKHYSTNIAAAWELDGEGWEWETYEDRFGLVIRVQHYNYAVYQDFFQRQSAFVKWADFHTKAEAYATARCRAWLKARTGSEVITI